MYFALNNLKGIGIKRYFWGQLVNNQVYYLFFSEKNNNTILQLILYHKVFFMEKVQKKNNIFNLKYANVYMQLIK